jgi:spore coat polysaccharide biosynthesis predicted glycosyltransferase SpsG
MLAFDEGPGAGLGHRRRCAVIAGALRTLGWETASAPVLGDGPGVVDAPVIVVDSYRTRADDRMRYRGGVVVALDDLARDLDVALVIDPAPGSSRAPHRRAGLVLAGAPYSLVDPALRTLGARPPRMEPHTVLVATGASDADGVGFAMAEAIVAACPELRVRLVLGPWGDRRIPVGVEAVERPDGLASELAAADIVVTAGGVALLESLCLGRPTVVLALAANQRANVDGVLAEGAALSADPAHVVDAVVRLLRCAPLRVELAEAGRRLIDGRGASRVAEAIVALSARVAA